MDLVLGGRRGPGIGCLLFDLDVRLDRATFVAAVAGRLGDDDSLMSSGRIDSTGVLELISFLEDAFGLELSEDDLMPENLDSVSRLTFLVERHQTRGEVRLQEAS